MFLDAGLPTPGCWLAPSCFPASAPALGLTCSFRVPPALRKCPVLYSLDPALLYSPQSKAPSFFCPYLHTLGSLLPFRVSTVVPMTNDVTCVPAPHFNQSLFSIPSTVLISLSGYPTHDSHSMVPSLLPFACPFFSEMCISG